MNEQKNTSFYGAVQSKFDAAPASTLQVPVASAALESLQDSVYLRLPEVLAIIPVCRTLWWEGIKAGRYPRGIKLSPRVTAWSGLSIRQLAADLKGCAPHTANHKPHGSLP